jgi:hypothetical protein
MQYIVSASEEEMTWFEAQKYCKDNETANKNPTVRMTYDTARSTLGGSIGDTLDPTLQYWTQLSSLQIHSGGTEGKPRNQ